MGRKLSQKQLAVLAGLTGARWKPKSAEKENLVHPNSLTPPRTATRAKTYTAALEKTINDQKTRILSLEASNSTLEAQNTGLNHELDDAHSLIHSLEESHATTTAHLSTLENELSIANNTISEQNTIIKQKDQRINRLVRDKCVLSSRLACVKQELLQAVLSAEESRMQSKKLSKDTANHIESLLLSVSRLAAAVSAQRSTGDSNARNTSQKCGAEIASAASSKVEVDGNEGANPWHLRKPAARSLASDHSYLASDRSLVSQSSAR
ncbi:hypothetical protein B0H17DRAFT_1136186 [Mycena rosella]|uniref:Uncharacterized protein n=1 Tax=Mycena rosella TaxID=1033263 RepID=A0AAD7DBX4_MYCRO|nr:hypothetical protein B0H17DRAFT_1136186 [Mycena rosella]